MANVEIQNVIGRLIAFYNSAKKLEVDDPCSYAVKKTSAWLHRQNKYSLGEPKKYHEEQQDTDDNSYDWWIV